MSSPSFRFAKPGLVEIIAGSVLSLLCGLILAALFLVFRPVIALDELPKQPKDGVVYFIRGSKDWNSGRRWLFKRDSFLQGHSVKITEAELNAWVENLYPPPPPPPPPSKDKKPVDRPWLQQGSPNLRVTPDGLSIAVTCEVNLLGITQQIVIQAEGVFAKSRDGLTFRPAKIYVGSLPVHPLRPAKSLVFRALTGLFEFPKDLEQAWTKVSSVSVEKNQLVLTVEGS